MMTAIRITMVIITKVHQMIVFFLLPWYDFADSNSNFAFYTSLSALSRLVSIVSIFSPYSWTYLAAS